jgi:hypothetical protein
MLAPELGADMRRREFITLLAVLSPASVDQGVSPVLWVLAELGFPFLAGKFEAGRAEWQAPIVPEVVLTTAIPSMPIVIVLVVSIPCVGRTRLLWPISARDWLDIHKGSFHRPDTISDSAEGDLP